MTATAPTDVKLTAHDLATAVRSRYEAPEWHVEKEVTLAGRRLDLVALNMWGARSYRVVGFELKVSRGDWLRELDQFQKSEEWNAVVDAFYVVTPPKLVKDDELPIGWGLLELTGSRMMTRKHATCREGSTVLPREIAARFISRLAQRDEQEDRTARYRASDELRKEAREAAEAKLGPEVAELRGEIATLNRERDELYKVLGISSSSWRQHENALRVAGVFATSMHDTTTVAQRIDFSLAALKRLTQQMQDAKDTITKLQPTSPESDPCPAP